MTSSGVGIERQHLVISLGLIAVAVYLVLGRFGFEFLLEQGTYFVATALLFFALRMRSWWPAAFLLAQVPFQGLIIGQFGLVGNFVSLTAVAAFFSTQRLERYPRILLGTNVQRLSLLFLLGVFVAFWSSERDLGAIVSLAQKVTLFLILATVVHAIRDWIRVGTLAKVAVASLALMYVLSLLAFYTGFSPIPGVEAQGMGLFSLPDDSLAEFRTGASGFGRSVGQSRFAFLGILPLMLSLGLIATRTDRRAATWFTIAAIVIGLGIFTSGSRAAAIGVALGVGIVLTITRRRWLRLGWVVMLLVAGVFLVLLIRPWGGTSYARIFQADESLDTYSNSYGLRVGEARTDMWKTGIDMFRDSPLVGVGLERFEDEAITRRAFPGSGSVGPHSAFIRVIAETGLLGIVPFAFILLRTLWVLVRKPMGETETQKVWRVVFLAAFIAMLVHTGFHAYSYDRFFWIPIAFAATLESLQMDRKKPARLKTKHVVEGLQPASDQLRQ